MSSQSEHSWLEKRKFKMKKMHRICSILSNFQLKCRKDKDDLSKEILLLLLFTKVMDKHVDMNICKSTLLLKQQIDHDLFV